VTITLEQYRRMEEAGEIKRPLTWAQTMSGHARPRETQNGTYGRVRAEGTNGGGG
jgi:hypothetical protein